MRDLLRAMWRHPKTLPILAVVLALVAVWRTREIVDIGLASVTKISDLEIGTKIQFTSSSGPTIKTITSDPNGSVTEPRGSLRIRTDAAALYQNTDASTTWIAFGTGGGSPTVTLTNNESGSIVIGAPVYSQAAGAVKNAKADAAGTAGVIGLVNATSIATTASGAILTVGPLTATTEQWDAVTGGSGGLTFNTRYYLDPTTAGKLTSTAPSTTGQYVVELCIAVSTTTCIVNPRSPILL